MQHATARRARVQQSSGSKVPTDFLQNWLYYGLVFASRFENMAVAILVDVGLLGAMAGLDKETVIGAAISSRSSRAPSPSSASADVSPAQTSFHILVDGLAFLSKVGGKRDSMSGGFGHLDSLPENRRRCTLCPGDCSLLAARPERVGACLGRAVQFMHEPAAHIIHSGHRQPNYT